jgi:amidase
MNACLQQTALVNPKVNAVCTLVAEQALDHAAAADKELKTRTSRAAAASGPLFGLPVGIKDLQITAGIKTTFGSRIYRDFVPQEDALIVQRYRAAGAVIVGKTNTPEFGAGSHTFNEVFGKTRNPYDLTRTCGGSSGGSAVALACGMMPIASGSDLGGSLRNPAAWNNVVGLRPSIGRVPRRPNALGWSSLSVDGPMARTVADIALQMSVIAGPDPAAPLSIQEAPSVFTGLLEWDPKAGRPAAAGGGPASPPPALSTGRTSARSSPQGELRKGRPARVAWSRDLGRYQIDAAVTKVVDAQRQTFERLGCEVEDASPDLSDADEIFQAYRAYGFAQQHEGHLRQHRDLMKQTVIWNTEQGLKLTALDMAHAEQKRTALYQRAVEFFSNYDFLVLPTTSVPPFDVNTEYVTEINGVKLKTYIDWFAICYAVSVTGFPSISVPAGFTDPLAGAETGLPVGLQIVGGPMQDWPVIQLAAAYEQATRIGERRPAVAL